MIRQGSRISEITVFLLYCLLHSGFGYCQQVEIRNNLLYDMTLTPNLGIAYRPDSIWSVGLNAGFNAWDIDKQKNKKWRHLLISPNVRRYFGHRADTVQYQQGTDATSLQWRDTTVVRRMQYIEANLIYSHFNVGNTRIPFGLYSGVKNRRLQGDLLAIGAKYGYSWMLGRDWRLEAEAGIAVGYAWYKEYDCATCGTFYGKDGRLFLLPLLGINISYIIDWKNK